MYQTESQGSLLEILRENEALNSLRFREAGIGDTTKNVRCPKCGLYESIIFWTPDKSRSDDLRFRCPNGCRTRIRFDPDEDEQAGKRDSFNPAIVNWILLPIVLYVIATETSWGRGMANQVVATSQAQITYLATVLTDSVDDGAPIDVEAQ